MWLCIVHGVCGAWVVVDGAEGSDAPLAGAGAGGPGTAAPTDKASTVGPPGGAQAGAPAAPAAPVPMPEGLSLEEVDVLLTRTSRAVQLLEDCLGVRRGFFFGSDAVSAPLMAAPTPAGITKTLSSMDSLRRLPLCEGEGSSTGSPSTTGAPSGGPGEPRRLTMVLG